MSAKEQDIARTLAGRIAARLAENAPTPERDAQAAGRGNDNAEVGDELAALRASVSEIGQRLAQIESHVTRRRDDRALQSNASGEARAQDEPSSLTRPAQNDRASMQTESMPAHWLSGTYVPAVHPSEERFGIDEAVSELVEFFEREKVCNVEPGGKPCDHCGMCSSRGF